MAEYTGTFTGDVLRLETLSAPAAQPKLKRVYEEACHAKTEANSVVPQTCRQNRQRKLRQNLFHRRCFELVLNAGGEEWFDAEACEPQEYEAPDEYLMARV